MTGEVGKSGTGIGKSGTGVALGGALSLALTTLVLLTVPVQSLAGSGLMVTEHNNHLVLSLHAGDQVVVGAVSRSQLEGGYKAFALHSALDFGEEEVGFRPLIKGSGSGASGESDDSGDASLLIKGSGSGASGESVRGPGASLLIKGSGSGASGESACDQGASLLIKGSGSGASGESIRGPGANLLIKGSGSGASGESACDQGASLLIKGSGSGASGESACGCTLQDSVWGVAEVVVDEFGLQLLIHRIDQQGLREYMVASIETAGSAVNNQVLRPDFVDVP